MYTKDNGNVWKLTKFISSLSEEGQFCENINMSQGNEPVVSNPYPLSLSGFSFDKWVSSNFDLEIKTFGIKVGLLKIKLCHN